MAKTDCHAVVVQFDSPRYEGTVACWLRGHVDPSLCAVGSLYDLYTRIPRPLPPTPLAPPPSPPRGPFTPPVQLINEMFRAGRPSNNINEVGVFLHQFDELEESPGRPWAACEGSACLCQGSRITGRISTMIVYRGLRDRPDRQGIPMPFGDRAGLVLQPPEGSVDCLYGIDAATYHIWGDRPGCAGQWCDPTDIRDVNGQICSFNGAPPAGAWRPSDMKQLLELHAEFGAQYHEPGFHSGYNEVILSAQKHNLNLPHSVLAFFVLDESNAHMDGVRIDVARARRAFISEYNLREEDAPLLKLDPHNWDTPFSVLDI